MPERAAILICTCQVCGKSRTYEGATLVEVKAAAAADGWTRHGRLCPKHSREGLRVEVTT